MEKRERLLFSNLPGMGIMLAAVLLLWAGIFSATAAASDKDGIVSLSPSASDLLGAFGLSSRISGLTYDDPVMVFQPMKLFSFHRPDIQAIMDLEPGLLIINSQQKKVLPPGPGTYLWPDVHSLDEYYKAIADFAAVCDKKEEGARILEKNKAQFDLIAKKMKGLPPAQRARVVFVSYAGDELVGFSPDFWPNVILRAAGAAAPDWENEKVISPNELRQMAPRIIMSLSEDKYKIAEILNGPKYKSAMEKLSAAHLDFPARYILWPQSNVSQAAAALSSFIYPELFAGAPILPDGIVGEKTLSLDLDYLTEAKVVESRILDFYNRTLLVTFKEGQDIISTYHGPRTAQKTIGNTYTPPPLWGVYHYILEQKGRDSEDILMSVLGLKKETASILFTGADLDNLAVVEKEADGFKITALITAGADSNAIRSSKDAGVFVERPGTINIILLPNKRLSPRAMTRAIITATEAKTAALWDLDIRSSQTPMENPATGTGTDDVIVAQGPPSAEELALAGGHTRLGQLIGAAVYDGTRAALLKQNRKKSGRSVFERLAERKIWPRTMYGQGYPLKPYPESLDFENTIYRHREIVLLSMSVSDAVTMNHIGSPDFFESVSAEAIGVDLSRVHASSALETILELLQKSQP